MTHSSRARLLDRFAGLLSNHSKATSATVRSASRGSHHRPRLRARLSWAESPFSRSYTGFWPPWRTDDGTPVQLGARLSAESVPRRTISCRVDGATSTPRARTRCHEVQRQCPTIVVEIGVPGGGPGDHEGDGPTSLAAKQYLGTNQDPHRADTPARPTRRRTRSRSPRR